MPKVDRNWVVSVFPDSEYCGAVGDIVARLGGSWKHLAIAGDDARHWLDAGGESLFRLENSPSTVDRKLFSKLVLNKMPAVGEGSRLLIISPTVCPLDLVVDSDGNWGDRAIFSHLLFANSPSAIVIERALRPQRVPLETYLLLCPMAMDRAVPRHLQDIVVVASNLEKHCPVEIWLQPQYEQAHSAFVRKDVSWLHVDTHGNAEAMMLGPSRSSRRLVEGVDLPLEIPVPLVVLVGCQMTAGAASIGAAMIERGVASVFGPCITFSSISMTGSDEAEAGWYETFFRSLLAGDDVGTGLLRARRSLTNESALKYAWLVLGSSLLSFKA